MRRYSKVFPVRNDGSTRDTLENIREYLLSLADVTDDCNDVTVEIVDDYDDKLKVMIVLPRDFEVSYWLLQNIDKIYEGEL